MLLLLFFGGRLRRSRAVCGLLLSYLAAVPLSAALLALPLTCSVLSMLPATTGRMLTYF